MRGLTDAEKARFFQRSFKAVDGLWFMKAEERSGFEAALELDRAVWQVFPKIQARELRAILGLGEGVVALRECFSHLLNLEGFTYRTEADGAGFRIVVTQCPWHDAMVKSGRAHLSGRIGEVICQTEYTTWAQEFGGTLRFAFGSPQRICTGAEMCVLRFTG